VNRQVRAAAFCVTGLAGDGADGIWPARVSNVKSFHVMRAFAVLALCASFAAPAAACSFAPGYAAFPPPSRLRPTMVPAPAPEVIVERIDRGYADGNRASCSDAGILVLKVPSDALGYRFELVAGTLGDDVFPAGYVRTVAKGVLRFVWLDGERDWQESIDVLVKITTMSSNGVPSEPKVLRIRHPGGVGPRR
jgi:hypothetical protein